MMRIIHFIAPFVLLAFVAALAGCVDDKDRGYETKLQPVITFVDEFIATNGRLPTDSEFHAVADKLAWMVVLRDRHHAYAAAKGAKTDLDYMIGIWRADWYHYYKSWDKGFINGEDEAL